MDSDIGSPYGKLPSQNAVAGTPEYLLQIIRITNSRRLAQVHRDPEAY
jgi:hypothetical protein